MGYCTVPCLKSEKFGPGWGRLSGSEATAHLHQWLPWTAARGCWRYPFGGFLICTRWLRTGLGSTAGLFTFQGFQVSKGRKCLRQKAASVYIIDTHRFIGSVMIRPKHRSLFVHAKLWPRLPAERKETRWRKGCGKGSRPQVPHMASPGDVELWMLREDEQHTVKLSGGERDAICVYMTYICIYAYTPRHT